ncbi:MAG: cell division protein FtsX [Candidatus Paceibacterota bacterium]
MKEVIKSIHRAPYQSLASFLVLFTTLFMTLFVFNLTSFFSGILSYVETRPQVIAYFDVNAKEKDILKLKSTLEKSQKISSVTYISQQDALKIYKELNKDNPLLLEMVSANILPASVEVYAQKPEYLSEIAKFLQKESIVDEVNFQKTIVDRLLTLTTILRRLSLGLSSFLIFISIVVMMTTTAFKIALKKEEIDLLQLLGASQWYIRKPFLIEGALFGFVSATLAFALFYGVYLYFNPFLSSYLTGIQKLPFFSLGSYGLFVYPPSISYIAASYFLAATFGVAIGLIGNMLATSKYIK